MQKEKMLVPKLRFSEFEERWTKLPFERIVKFVKSGKSKKDENGTYNLYGSTGIIGKTNDNIDEGEYLLVARVGANAGQINLTKGIFGVSDNTLIVSFKNDIKIEFVKEFLIQFDLNRLVFGSGQPLVTGGLLKKIKIVMPQQEEQQKIANFLTSIDTQIQTLEKKKSLLAQYKKGVLQKIFKQELRFKDENGSDFSEWEEKKLGEYLTHKSRRNKKLEVTRTLSVSNSKGFVLQSEQFDNHRVASKDVSNYKIVEKNDIAYNPSRINVGSIATLKDFEIGIVSPMYVVFSLKDTLDLTFFENLISTHLFKHLVKVGCSGSVRDSLNFDDLESFKLKIPSLAEQIKIANFLSAIDKNIDLVNKKIEYTKGYKKGLLQQMFV